MSAAQLAQQCGVLLVPEMLDFELFAQDTEQQRHRILGKLMLPINAAQLQLLALHIELCETILDLCTVKGQSVRRQGAQPSH